MIKEAKKIDFLTTGRQPSEQDFARISEWIKRDKQKKAGGNTAKKSSSVKRIAQQGLTKRRTEA